MRLSHPVRVLAVAACAAGLLFPVGQQPASADDPIFLDWPSLLPGLTLGYDPSSENDCVAGRPHCVNATIREMERRFEDLGRACSHQAVFALAYLRTTQAYKWARDQAGFFSDTPWVNHEDAVFAKFYFDAYDNWASGARSQVPQAWLIAFDAAANRRVTGGGNLLLGMNAHINRDLPFTVAGIGINTPDGQSRKPDHDQVNEFLNTVVQPLLAELNTRYDPSIVNLVTPYGVGYTGLFQTVAAWRELAWRNAELLAAAPTPQLRAVIAAEVELTAATQATLLSTANSYLPPLHTSVQRDAHCATHHALPPPMTYSFGTASAY
ncbi:MAG: DUF5995 family protein [Sporichthyaceae bacterium]|nr:DUF5995 family protein [Sporichthyaceae bacterium]